jgi:hypothetical protein
LDSDGCGGVPFFGLKAQGVTCLVLLGSTGVWELDGFFPAGKWTIFGVQEADVHVCRDRDGTGVEALDKAGNDEPFTGASLVWSG